MRSAGSALPDADQADERDDQRRQGHVVDLRGRLAELHHAQTLLKLAGTDHTVADLGYPLSERLKVIPQDGSDGRDTGLIGLQLLKSLLVRL